MSEPAQALLIDHILTGNGDWTREWYCAPPPDGTPYTVVRDEWSDDYETQRIYEVKL